MITKGSRIAITIVCVVLGLMLALQFRIQQRINTNPAYQRTEDLTRRLTDAEKERDLLQKEIEDLRNKVAQAAEGRNIISTLTGELENARLVGGLLSVTGPGITVTMDDSKRPKVAGEDPNAYIIHDDDILKVVNEMWASGAEAISINGQRLIAKTEIRCVGPSISINGVRTTPPIVIKAIGEAATLEAGLRLRGGVVDTLSLWGIEVAIKKEEEIVIPAYTGSVSYTHARVVKKSR